ncbi:MAG: hypothetical protein NT131_02045 [Methanomassiliicoccales archaeon]|nr:hypothetical protein [Methanomassiliicoccales archaeon]
MFEDDERRERLLRAWADDLDRKGFTELRVNLDRYPEKPEGFGQHVPDIVARRKDGRRLVGEIWFCESLERNDMFSRAMSYAYRGDVVMLLVPFDCLEEAEGLVREWGLSSEIFVQGILD